jgi:prefoldin subunit 5
MRTMAVDNGDKPRRDMLGILAMAMSIGALLVTIGGNWSSQSATTSFHERRITALEDWQKETRPVLHEMDKKLDRVLDQLQAQAKEAK